jgi:hypothetical protein
LELAESNFLELAALFGFLAQARVEPALVVSEFSLPPAYAED